MASKTLNQNFNFYLLGLLGLIVAYYLFMKNKFKEDLKKGIKEVVYNRESSLEKNSIDKEKEVVSALISPDVNTIVKTHIPLTDAAVVKASNERIGAIEKQQKQTVYLN